MRLKNVHIFRNYTHTKTSICIRLRRYLGSARMRNAGQSVTEESGGGGGNQRNANHANAEIQLKASTGLFQELKWRST